MRRLLASLCLTALVAGSAAYAQTSPPSVSTAGGDGQPVGGTPPRVTAISAVTPQKATTFVVNKWTAQVYGFAEFDAIHDTREGVGEVPGNPVLPHAGTYAADNGRTQFTIRNSRLGFRFSSPDFRGMKGSGLIETDFFGNQPNGAGGNTEGSFFNNAGLRVRHAVAKLETPYGDVLGGQYWELFGWQPYFHPNTLEIQGVPGQIYSRTGQFRLSETFRSDPVTVEVAVAALRPPQRDASTPDAQGGLRLALNHWQGVHTAGSTGTAVDPLMIGVSGVVRRFALQTPNQPVLTQQSTATGWGISVDGLIPIIPAKADDRSNALTATASWVRGQGIQDLYSGFANGIAGVNVLGTNSVDPGLVAFNGTGLDAIQVRSFMVGLQYYLPVDRGSVWLAGNYSQVNSDNAMNLAPTSAGSGVFKRQRWADGAIFWDATQSVRFGAEVAWFEDVLRDNTLAHDQRYQFSMFYLF